MHNFEIPTKEEMDRAVVIVTAITCGVIIVKLLDRMIDCIREHRQNKQLKKLSKKIDLLDARVEKIENEKMA